MKPTPQPVDEAEAQRAIVRQSLTFHGTAINVQARRRVLDDRYDLCLTMVSGAETTTDGCLVVPPEDRALLTLLLETVAEREATQRGGA